MSTRLSRGRSTPAIRANAYLLPLPLLVPRVRADHADRAAPTDQLAPVADLLDRRSHLHVAFLFIGGPSLREVRPPGLPLRCLSPSSLVAVHDTAARQVVRRQLHEHPVPREDPDVVHPHLPRDMGQHVVSVLELDPEHGVGGRARPPSLALDGILLRQAPGSPSILAAPDPPAGEPEPPPDGGGP